MRNKVFIVTMSGVYIREVIGVFSTDASAEKALDRLYKKNTNNMFDGYHDFHITPVELDETARIKNRGNEDGREYVYVPKEKR